MEKNMKSKGLAVLLASTVLMTACNAAEETTVASTSEETTTEATTTTTTEETTTETTYVFTNDDYASVVVFSGIATGFDWGSNAKLGIETEEEFDSMTFMLPTYPANEDIVITFKSDKELGFGVFKGNREAAEEKNPFSMQLEIYHSDNVEKITDGCPVTNDNGSYSLTIPAKYVEDGYFYQISFINGDSSYNVLICCKAKT